MDVEVNPADVAGIRTWYRPGTAEFRITLSALYQLLLLNPQRGCAILSGLREWERSRRSTDTWAANTPCWASLRELAWVGCADEEILLSSCGLSPPTPGSPSSTSPAKPPPPRQETQTPCAAPTPKPTQPKKPPPPPKSKSFESGSSSSSDQEHPCGHGKGVKGKQPQQQKRREEPPSLEGDESPDSLLGALHRWCLPGGCNLGCGGVGGRVWVEHPGEKEMFRIEKHLFYDSHAAAVTHWEQQKAVAAGKKAAKAKKKPNPKTDADPPAEPVSKPAKPEPKPETK